MILNHHFSWVHSFSDKPIFLKSQMANLLIGGFNPSEKYQSVGIIIPNIWKNESHVPNHQPDLRCSPVELCGSMSIFGIHLRYVGTKEQSAMCDMFPQVAKTHQPRTNQPVKIYSNTSPQPLLEDFLWTINFRTVES